MVRAGDLLEITFNSPQKQFSVTYESKQEVTVDLGGARSEADVMATDGSRMKRDYIEGAKAELPNIANNNDAYINIIEAQRLGAVGTCVLTLTNGDKYKIAEAFFVGDTNLNLYTGTISAVINGKAYPASKKLN